ncbi:MAG TPA: DUF222 domain-containing protein [Actinomycetota bacterium]|nr:DUF222 domain-containing protein [Actinomycetota bacterium]
MLLLEMGVRVCQTVPEIDESSTSGAVVDAFGAAVAAFNCSGIRLLRMIVECDLRRVWRTDNESEDVASWLVPRLGISRWKARRMVEAAYAIDEMPRAAAALEKGRLSLDQFMELARFPTPAQAESVLAWACNAGPAAIRARADRARREDVEDTRWADRSRNLEWWWQDPTTFTFWGTLPADQGMRFAAAIDRLADKLASSPVDGPDRESTIDQRRADALVAMAMAQIAEDPDPDRATIVVHVTVGDDGNPVGRNGMPLPKSMGDLLMCGSRVERVIHERGGNIIGIGSPSYVVPRGMRRQIEFRDHNRCTFPGCERTTFVQVHHIVPWPQGQTVPENLILLCPAHHRLVHIHGWHVELKGDGRSRWFRPDWTPFLHHADLVSARE